MDILNGSAKSLFVLYLMLGANYLGTLFSCDVQNIIKNNTMIKHFLGFLTLYFFISLSSDNGNKDHPMMQLMLSILIYFCFVVSSKVHYNIFMIFVLLIGLVYILFIIKESFPDLAFNKYIPKIQTFLIVCGLVLLVIGFAINLKNTKFNEGGYFTYGRYFFGTPICRVH